MKIHHCETQPTRDHAPLAPLRQLEHEARRLRTELAGDPMAQRIVALDLLIRRTAYRAIAAGRRLAAHLAATFQGEHGRVGGHQPPVRPAR